MPLFCDVALAVPLDMVFTYAIPPGMEPVVGGRVLVPFRQQRMSGIVVELHDRPPQVNASLIKIKKVIEALDLAPVLDEHLLKLGKWIADYYLAPLGEVFRTMLPLSAEFKRSIAYRITDEGRMALHLAGMSGSPARSKRTPEQQLVEFRVLDYLAERESVQEQSLRGATRVGKALLSGMVRKKWIAREDVSAARDAARLVKIAVLRRTEERDLLGTELNPSLAAEGAPPRNGPEDRHHTRPAKKLNANQRTLVETLAAAGGRVPVEALRGLDVPRTTLSTLVRRGLIELVDEPQALTAPKLKPRPSPFEFEFSAAQKNALANIGEAVASRKFAGLLLHGITGSGKTAVYLACMRQVLEQGRSSILLVPEIGLTPAVAADLHQVFGDEVAILHSGFRTPSAPSSGIASGAARRGL
jgi:primosomal protein N' (replication factor Y) (superfamily II helicase)